MQQNPNQRMQDQMQQQREQQRRQAAYVQQQGEPLPKSGGCAGMIRVGLTFVLSLIGFAVICGGGGFVVGNMVLDSETAALGGAAGGLLAFVLAAVVTIRAASR